MTQIDEPNLDKIRKQLDEIFTKLTPVDIDKKGKPIYFELKPFVSQLDKAMALIATQIQEAKEDEIYKMQLAQQSEDWNGFCIDDTSDFYNYCDKRIAQLRSNT